MSVETSGSPAIPKSDTERLHELGYAQELGRKMQGFSNMAVSFSIISILAGCLTTYYLALFAGGGPAVAYGWPIVTVMALIVAMSMGEVCSHYPTAGGLYYWSAKLAKRNARVLELDDRMVQPHRPGRHHRQHRLRARQLHRGLPRPHHRLRAEPRFAAVHLRRRARPPRRAQHARDPDHRPAERHQRVVAPGRRRRVPRVPGGAARPARRRRSSCSPTSRTTPGGAGPGRGSTCSSSACCSPSTRSPGSTPRPT